MAKKKQTGLGKGLEALFQDININKDEVKKDNSEEVLFFDINQIKPNVDQPRKSFNKESLEDLANSIEENGIIQPIIVRPSGEGYEIVAGERRWRAARQAKLKQVPCIVRDLTDEENMLFAIIENMQREDLNPIEEAQGVEKMMKKFKLTQEEVSKNIGKSRPYVANIVRLLKLPEEIKEMIGTGSLSGGHGKALLAITDEKEQLALARKALQDDLSVRELEELAKGEKKSKRKQPRKRKKSADIITVETELKNALGTKVNIKQSGKKGKIEVEYYSQEELERLIEVIKGD